MPRLPEPELTPPPRGEHLRVLFKSQKPLVIEGQLAPHAAEAIAAQAQRLEAAQMVIVICLGQKHSPVAGGIQQVGATTARAVRQAVPKVAVSWSAAELNVESCPRGLVLEGWRPPPHQKAAALHPLGGQILLKLPNGKRQEAVLGVPLVMGSGVETTTGARCAVRFVDGSVARLGEQTRIKLEAVSPYGRVFLFSGRLSLFSGTGKRASIETTNALVDLTSGRHRISFEKKKIPITRVESLAGLATLIRGEDRWPLQVGTGALVRGKEVVAGVALPAKPQGLRPVRGQHALPQKLTWEAVEGSVQYQLWVATDVRFDRIAHAAITAETEYMLAGLASGDYFWRVTAVNGEGFAGRASQLFRLTLIHPENQQE